MILTGQTLQFLLADKTHVLERNGKEAYVYLAGDGTGHMLLDNGERRSGTWQPLDDGYATRWDSGQQGEWTLVDGPEGLSYASRDGTQRLKMIGILFGDAKELAVTQS